MAKFFETKNFTLPNNNDGETPEEEEYDAINNETFGGEIHDLDGDLEEFANRTAGLLLDEPGCSSGMINGTWSESEILSLMKGAKTLEEIECEQFPRVMPQCSFVPTPLPFSALDIHPEGVVWPKVDVASSNIAFDLSRPPPNLSPFSHSFSQATFGVPSISRATHVERLLPRVPGQWMPTSQANGIHRPYPLRPSLPQCGHRNFLRPQQYSNNRHFAPLNKGQSHRDYAQCYTFSDLSAQQYRESTSSLSRTMTNGRGGPRPRGLPSTRTISDFAFDPYAGFMSKKEREWLIKIHLIQCTSTGNPTEDDFYYTIWKKRNVLKKQPRTFKIQPRYYSFDETYPSATYVPPSFSGSLGRPSHCSAKIPRQLIDVTAEATEADINKQTQKKLKAMLMRIENAHLLLIECETFKEQLSADKLEADQADVLRAHINENLLNIMEMVTEDGVLPTLMMIQKGRTFLFELMNFCDVDELFGVLKIVVDTLPKYAKKVPENSVMEFGKNLSSLLFKLPNERFRELASSLGAQHDSFKNVRLAFTIVLSFLAVFAKRSDVVELPEDFANWLHSAAPVAGNSADSFHTVLIATSVDELFAEDDQRHLHDWIQKIASVHGRTDVASTLSRHFASRNLLQNAASI